jgi:FemAB-related protein (PEP-CTERM system-associated)
VLGILPLVHIEHWLFGNSLVSMPFCDAGGVLARDGLVERRLVEHGLRVADALHVPALELRQYQPLACLDDPGFCSDASPRGERVVHAVPGWRVSTTAAGNKVRMLLALPENPDALMQSFKAKLRSQIRKPIKDGLTVRVGGVDLLDDFYGVFATNMRDLGSPVHSRRFIQQILLGFPERANIFVVYGSGVPMACSLTLGFNGVLSNPWASSLRRYSQFAPNMLLYWTMLEHACRQGYRTFDFGRSTVDEGTYRFKEQWGARPAPLYWYRFARNDVSSSEMTSGGRWMSRAMECWKRLPVPVTRVLGPKIRRHISL